MILKNIIKKEFLKDIRFWIVLFFVIRLWGITNPPLEVAHNWRQTTVTMVSRNFYEISPDIFYPRIDFAGEKTGITGMEFPLLNYLSYLVSLVFGYAHWYGRLINLIVSSFGIFYFFKLVTKYFDKNIAFYSSLVLLASIWFAYSRKIMPDTFSMSFTLIGFYFGTNYLDGKYRRLLHLFFYFLFTLIGVISKLPSGYFLILFLFLFTNKNISIQAKIIFSVTTFALFVPVALWYFYWVPILVEVYRFWHFFMGKSLLDGFREISHNLNDTFAHFYDYALKFIGFGLFVFGLCISFIHRNKKVWQIFLLSFSAFLIIIFKAGFTFSHHSYYIIPFVPVMAFVCGFGISKIANQKIVILIIIGIVLEGVLNQQHEFFLKDKELAIVTLEKKLDAFSDRKDLIVINSNENPTPMYFSHRKGWLATNTQLTNEQFIGDIKSKGCKYAVVLKRYLGTEIILPYQMVFSNENFTIYKL